jgi:hypothetical protein
VLTQAADRSVRVADKEPPAVFDASIKSLLQAKAVQIVQDGMPVYEFWFRAELPLKSKPTPGTTALKSLAETTLLGVVSVATSERDYRDDELFAGLYTVRFSLQPQDGNHLGTADYPYFAVLTPAKLDRTLDGIPNYKALVKASAKESSTDHPFIMSLRPVTADDGDYPRLTEPAPDHKAIRLKLAAKAGETPATLVFDLVVEGVAVH